MDVSNASSYYITYSMKKEIKVAKIFFLKKPALCKNVVLVASLKNLYIKIIFRTSSNMEPLLKVQIYRDCIQPPMLVQAGKEISTRLDIFLETRCAQKLMPSWLWALGAVVVILAGILATYYYAKKCLLEVNPGLVLFQ
jgi:hypothetical protein